MRSGAVPMAAALGAVLVTALSAVFAGQSYLWLVGSAMVATLVMLLWPR